mgnify:FL=1
MSNSKKVVGFALTSEETTLARADIKTGKTFKEARNSLIAVLSEHRDPQHMDKPSKGECTDFYDGINKLSFEAFCGKTSIVGSPDGKSYDVMALLEMSSELTPEWAKVKGSSPRGGDETIKQYYQRGRGDWKKSLKRSWEAKIAAENALFASPDERTRGQVKLLIVSVETVIKRIKKLDPENSDIDFGITEAHQTASQLLVYIGGTA